MDRRQFLKRTGQLAVGTAAASLWPRTGHAQELPDAMNVELVTLTDEGAVITFDSEAPTEALLLYGPDPTALDSQVADPGGRTRFHRLEIEGLRSGQPVYYRIEVDGVPVPEGAYSPGVLTPLTPPEGPLLFTFATVTDMHCGLMSAGAVGGLSSFEPVECPLSDPTCWQVANQGVIEAINQAAPAFTIAKGDLSHEYRAEEFEAAQAFLSSLDAPFYPVRGNHDRQGENPQDLFPLVFGLEKTHYAFDHLGVRFIVLDSSNLETGFPEIGEGQFAWLEAELSSLESTQAFFLVLHHALTEEASPIFSLFGQDQMRLFELLRSKKGLAGVLSGHSHRNIVTHQAELGQTPCIETSSTVHYPGGFNLYRVHTGGYQQTYHVLNGPEWREWALAGRQMYKGDAQQILMGSLGDRCFSHPFARSLPDPTSAQCGCGCAQSSVSSDLALGSIAIAAGISLAKLNR